MSDLFDQFANFKALLAATDRAARGKRGKPGAAAFLANREPALLNMLDALHAGTWRPGTYTVLDITEPKVRRVSAAPFADRVLHQALCAVIAPLFERVQVGTSRAGTHATTDRGFHARNAILLGPVRVRAEWHASCQRRRQQRLPQQLRVNHL